MQVSIELRSTPETELQDRSPEPMSDPKIDEWSGESTAAALAHYVE
jgi:hypothetical protein